jgi:Xaa-Pro dipeptidase
MRGDGRSMENRSSANPTMMDFGKARALMEEKEIDVLLISLPKHVYYASNFNSFDCLIASDAQTFAVLPKREDQERYLVASHSERFWFEDFPTPFEKVLLPGYFYVKGGEEFSDRMVASSLEGLTKAIRELGYKNGRIGIEGKYLPISTFQSLRKSFPRAKLIDASDILIKLRTIKGEEEIARLRKAADSVQKGIQATFDSLSPGITERELDRVFRERANAEGVDTLYVQVSFGGRGAYGPALATDRVLKGGELVRLDASTSYKGYASDIGRFAVAGKASQEMKDYYAVTFRAEQAAIQKVKAKARVCDIFNAAVAIPLEAGYVDYKRHHVGHGIGLDAHETPILSPKNEIPLEKNMVLCIETPYYIWGLGGFAPEDIVVVTETGHELLTTPQKEIIEV